MSTKVNTRKPKGKLRVADPTPKVGSKSKTKGKKPVGEEWDEQPHADPEDVPMLIKTSEDEQAYRIAQMVFGVYNHG